MQTRAQHYSRRVYTQINELNLSASDIKVYQSLCHSFPIMVLRSGLAQSVAFLWIKASGENASPAYMQFLQHIQCFTENHQQSIDEFQHTISEMDLAEYQRTTRTILNACIWYKRFAVSMLNGNADDTPLEGENNHA